MAVQAQYPSNILLLNRNGQEGHDYSLQPQPGGFLDQSHMLFTNGAIEEKEAEVEKATRRNAELEARAAQLSVEAQVWQAKARAQEATAASLQAQLQQAIMSGGMVTQDNRRGDEGGIGCSGGVDGQAEDAESAYVDPERVTVTAGPSCKRCRKRAATVVVLPCRHLCLCTECDQTAQACPLCLQVRNSSVEVFLY
ncbi:hypothetical protein GH714_013669 [Hevea brasiliensis]|uniref:RING-type domain-containing protein n=1 Tax=Hevea brasiliensis TaxID=3981 RepID=A0A6A6M9T0_HEVBR|nr:hypothetical protein GH714_013669 [Hevea brasiliensis]